MVVVTRDIGSYIVTLAYVRYQVDNRVSEKCNFFLTWTY